MTPIFNPISLTNRFHPILSTMNSNILNEQKSDARTS